MIASGSQQGPQPGGWRLFERFGRVDFRSGRGEGHLLVVDASRPEAEANSNSNPLSSGKDQVQAPPPPMCV